MNRVINVWSGENTLLSSKINLLSTYQGVLKIIMEEIVDLSKIIWGHLFMSVSKRIEIQRTDLYLFCFLGHFFSDQQE